MVFQWQPLTHDVGLEAGGAAPAIGVARWYRDMTTCWMSAEPLRRRCLVLRVHRWIADRVLIPMARGEEPAVADLDADGVLALTLISMVPPRRDHANHSQRNHTVGVQVGDRAPLAPRHHRKRPDLNSRPLG